MGYSHSWEGFLDSHPKAFLAIRADFEKLILPLADLGCSIPLSGAAMANAVTKTSGFASKTGAARVRLHSSPTMWR